MSSHQASAKARSSKCRHFCYPFDAHNYCPTCRESGKGDNTCVTNQSPCNICDSFTEEQQIKINHRHRYIRKQKRLDHNTSKDDLDLLGDDGDAFSGSQADLEGAAENLFSSPPRPQPLRFESLSLKAPQTVPPTPGSALQNKIENRLEKSLGSTFNVQLKQEMGVFQASMLEAMKSLRDKMLSFKKASKSDVVKMSDSTKAGPKPGPSNQPDPIPTWTSIFRASDHSDVQPMDTNFMDLHFLPSLLKMSSPSLLPSNRILNPTTWNIIPSRNTPKRCVLKPKSILTKGSTRYGQNIILSRLLQRKMSPLPQLKSLLKLNIRLLRSLNIRIAQIQSFTGR